MSVFICPKERLPELLPLGQRFFTMAHERGIFNPESFMNFWTQMYDKDSGLVVVSGDEDCITGAFGVIMYTDPLTGDLVATETFWYSEGREGLKLLDKAVEVAEICKVKELYLQHFNIPYSEKIMRHYSRKGFVPKYTRWTKEF